MGQPIARRAPRVRGSRNPIRLLYLMLAIFVWLSAGTAVRAEPEFKTTPVTSVDAGERYLYEIEAIDPDADSDKAGKGKKRPKDDDDDDRDDGNSGSGSGRELTITAGELPDWLNFSSKDAKATLEGRPDRDDGGRYRVELRATGGDGAVATQRFTITVVVVNSAPSFTDRPETSASEDSVYRSRIRAEDRDGDRLTFSAVTLPRWLGIAATSEDAVTLEGVPSGDDLGRHRVEIRVADGRGESDRLAFEIFVSERDDSLLIRPVGDQSATEGVPFRLELSAFVEDEESPDELTYDVRGLPPGLGFDRRSGLIDGVPRLNGDAERYRVRLTVSDGRNAVADEFNLNVLRRGRIDLALSISTDQNPVTVNGRANWVFTVANHATSASADAGARIEASFQADTPITFDPLPGGCTLSLSGARSDISCTTGPIPANGQTSIRWSSTASRAGDVFVGARVEPAGRVPADDKPENDAASETLAIAQRISASAAQTIAGVDVAAAASGDVDGDGHIDLALGMTAAGPVRLHLNVVDPKASSKRMLSESAIRLGASQSVADIALFDIDRDGDLDIIAATGNGAAATILENSGELTFVARRIGSAADSRAVTVGDVNGDGFADVVFANAGPNPLFRNEGAGVSLSLDAELGNNDSSDVLLTDLAGSDGLPELVVANRDGNALIYANNGGRLGTPIELPTGPTTAVASADLNGDGLLDLVFGRATSTEVPSNLVFLNASGSTLRFSGRPDGLGASPTSAVLTIDADEDRDTDLLFANANGVHQIFVNSSGSSAIFALYPEQLATARARTAVADSFSVDGRIDIAIAGSNGVSIFHSDGKGSFGPGDREPPVLRLNGAAEVNIDVGAVYSDPGATASDSTDGDVSERIRIENAVDSSVIGTYTVRYEVTDRSGNAATPLTRTVRVGPREASGGGGGGAFGVVALFLLVLVHAASRLAAVRRAASAMLQPSAPRATRLEGRVPTG